MHEFGHDLNLHHGGVDDVNCKPNYLSVMSYARQIAGSSARAAAARASAPRSSDASGFARHGYPQDGVVLGVPGTIAGGGAAAQFDGRAAYGYVPSVPAPSQAYTLEAWANATAARSQTIVDHGGAGALYPTSPPGPRRSMSATARAPHYDTR